MAIDPQFIVNLKGKSYPTWPGVLDAATKAGLKSLTTRIIQVPDASNGHVAVVMARAEFDDGRVFEDVGDASPANCSAQIATAALRMASTRGKGRACRDAINVGQTMWEELPDDEKAQARSGAAGNQARTQGERSRQNIAIRPAESAGDRAATATPAAGADVGAVAPVVEFWCAGCGQEIKPTKKRPASEVARLSREQFGAELCVHCVQEKQTLATANVPSGQIAA